MKIHHLLLTICTMLFICSCELPAISWVPPETSTLLTGESLAGTELSYIKPETEYIQVRNDRFCFSFKVDLSNYIKEKKNRNHNIVIPSDELFSAFGSNKKAVKNEYDRIHQDVFNTFNNYIGERRGTESMNVVTILYNGGITLTCQSEFAGCPAGENIARFFSEESSEDPIIAPWFNTPSNLVGGLEIPLDYISMTGEIISFSIPVGDYELVKTGANFRLEIPVRVVYYLQGLNDKNSNPDAAVPYKDEVLTCSFRSQWTLR